VLTKKESKIKNINELAFIINTYKNAGKLVVHCHGVFDLLHIGHIRYFDQAKAMGHILVVTITPDRFVDKGPHRPAFNESLRAEAVASLAAVDYVAINEWPTAEETLRILKPNIYVKGSEFKDTSSDVTGKIGREELVVKEIGAKLRFSDDIVFSSSNLINRYLSHFSEEIQEYLPLFRSRHSLENVLLAIEGLSGMRALVVGDTIIDEYHYCDAIGKSSKEPCLAMKYQSHELFAGGVMAIANHCASFAKSVDVLTTLGGNESYKDLIESKLATNIRPIFNHRPNSPTTVKRRYVEGYTFSKLFEIYIMEDSPMPEQLDSEQCAWLADNLNEYDVVVAADFGHGAISNNMIKVLINQSPFLCVMTQANAGNRGFNTISKYPRADFVCIAEHEIRLETRDLLGSLRPMVGHLGEKLTCPTFIVTQGRKGCLVSTSKGEFVQVPSFASNVVDRVGAGDAFLAVTSLLARKGADHELIGFIGNVVGALAVEVIGNAKAVDKLATIKFITSLLK